MDLVAHEITHIQQYLDGKLWVENGELMSYDLTDELEAYRNQHIIKYGSLAGQYNLLGNPAPKGNYVVTIEEILRCFPGTYDNLPQDEMNYTPPTYGSNPTSARNSARNN